MKKVLLLLLILCLALTGCGEKPAVDPETPQAEEESGLSWDMEEYGSLDELNKAAGTNIVAEDIENKGDERFELISGSIAQYSFKVNDEAWTIRGAKDTENDISGLYYDNFTFDKDLTSVLYNDEVYAERFFFEEFQYVIILDVKDKEIARSYFDEVCGKIQTAITGVQSGYETDIQEVGDDVVYTATVYNQDGTKTIMEIIYHFEEDKMTSIKNVIHFETEEAAKDYYDLLIENGTSADSLVLEGLTITSDNSGNVEFYSDTTKAQFVEQMKSAMAQ